jgi:hypothetical protein
MAEKTGSVVEAQKREPLVAPMNTLTLLEFNNARWRLNVQAGTTPDDLISPELYSVVSGKLRAFDIIECVSPDFWAEVLVRSSQRGSPVQVVGLRFVNLPKLVEGQADDCPPNHDVRYDPTDGTYQGVRISDGATLTPKLNDRTLALREMQDHATLRESVARRWHEPPRR